MVNYYKLFYWLTVSDGLKSAFDSFSNIFTFMTIIGAIAYFVFIGICSDSSAKEMVDGKWVTPKSMLHWRKLTGNFFWMSFILCFVSWIGYALVPTKKDALLIVAGGATMNFLSTDSAAKQVPHEALNFVVTSLKSMAAEAKVDIGIATEKEKVLESVKGLTVPELIDRMKADTTLAKIVLDK